MLAFGGEEKYLKETTCCCCCAGEYLQEGYGFSLASFARSPSVILAALVGPLILQLAETDALCQTNPATSLSSGVDGSLCMSNGEFALQKWDETLWQSFNGSSCGVSSELFDGVSYDIGKASTDEVCAGALMAYRAVTSFTCNCTGDYAFLESGVRPGTILTFSATMYYLIMVFVAPVVGALSDVTPHRKRMWLIFASIYVVSVSLMTILGQHNVWVAALFFSTTAGPAYGTFQAPQFRCIACSFFLHCSLPTCMSTDLLFTVFIALALALAL